MTDGFVPADDGLPVSEVGAWTRDKHVLLRRYVGISAGVRAGFIGPGKAGATYIDLFCGPGYCRVRDAEGVLPGSALVAALAAAERKRPFSAIHIGDADPRFPEATRRRLLAGGITSPVRTYSGNAADVARQVARNLNPHALHLVFLDPFSLGALSMPIIEAFAPFKRVDLLMHVSAMDLQRNLEQAIASDESHQFDSFAPGWRDHVDQKAPAHTVRRRIIEYWIGRVQALGFSVFEGDQFELVRGSKNQPLYWLALAAKNEKASEFWDKIRHVDPQQGLGF